MDLGLRGKVAAVAAASQGLGKAVAWELAREGARVAICGRRPDILRTAVDALPSPAAPPIRNTSSFWDIGYP